MLVKYTLDGMVFAESLPTTDAVAVTDPAPTGTVVAQLISGGMAKDSHALFSLTGGTFPTESTITLTTGGFAMSGTSGTITMEVTNTEFARIFGDKDPTAYEESPFSGAIVLKKALMIERLPSDPMDTVNDRIATVGSEYMMFRNAGYPDVDTEVSVISLGSVMVNVDTMLRLANTNSGNVDTLSSILSDPAEADDNYVKFMGDFSFTSQVHVDPNTDGDCLEATPASIQTTDDDDNVLDKTEAVQLDTFAAAQHLCVTVSPESIGENGIPDTEHFMAMFGFTGLDNAVYEPEAMTRSLRRIRRDGTTVHIPYLTTYEGYNQRIVLSNRGTRDAIYRIMFRTEDGVTADPMMTEDMTLGAGTTVTMRAENLVELTGGSRTAATIMLEARPETVDVTSVIVNMNSQDTDTVVHHSLSM
jgi:hypothetical protein